MFCSPMAKGGARARRAGPNLWAMSLITQGRQLCCMAATRPPCTRTARHNAAADQAGTGTLRQAPSTGRAHAPSGPAASASHGSASRATGAAGPPPPPDAPASALPLPARRPRAAAGSGTALLAPAGAGPPPSPNACPPAAPGSAAPASPAAASAAASQGSSAQRVRRGSAKGIGGVCAASASCARSPAARWPLRGRSGLQSGRGPACCACVRQRAPYVRSHGPPGGCIGHSWLRVRSASSPPCTRRAGRRACGRARRGARSILLL